MSKGTTLRNVRVADELWQSALKRADKDGISVSEVLRELLEAWVDGRVELK
jgi:predicted CopG family antitoxin